MSDNGNIFDVDNLNADTHKTTANKKKTAVVVSAVVLLLLAGGGGGYIALNSNVVKGWVSSKEVVDTRTPEEIAIEEKAWNEIVELDSKVEKTDEYFLENPSPIKLSEWQLTAVPSDPEERAKNLDSGLLSSVLAGSGSTLPSEAAGFTNNPDKQFNDDGSLNIMYSYWTKESFERDLYDNIETLLNPIYGGWAALQEPGFTESEVAIISAHPMFSQKFIEANQGKNARDWLPVYADWDENDYGMGDKLPKLTYRWFGEVTSSDLDFSYNEDTSSYSVSGTVNVKFTTWTKDKGQLEKTGVLKFRAVPGETESGNRVVFDEITLTIGD